MNTLRAKDLIWQRKLLNELDFEIYQELQDLFHNDPEHVRVIWEYDIDWCCSDAKALLVFSNDTIFLDRVAFKIRLTDRVKTNYGNLIRFREEGFYDHDGNEITDVPSDADVVFLNADENYYNIPIHIYTKNKKININELYTNSIMSYSDWSTVINEILP